MAISFVRTSFEVISMTSGKQTVRNKKIEDLFAVCHLLLPTGLTANYNCNIISKKNEIKPFQLLLLDIVGPFQKSKFFRSKYVLPLIIKNAKLRTVKQKSVGRFISTEIQIYKNIVFTISLGKSKRLRKYFKQQMLNNTY